MAASDSGQEVALRMAARPARGGGLWQNHLKKGFISRINLSDSRRSENTINTHKYNTIY
jgi:hypothetical protein